jgi:DNA-binding CsgD family transcriptional regulator
MLPDAGNVDVQAPLSERLAPSAAEICGESALDRIRRTLPYRVLATNDFKQGARLWGRDAAAGNAREIAPDPPGWLTALRFDLDDDPITETMVDPDGDEHTIFVSVARTKWSDVGLPPPNLMAINRRTLHAHYTYLLANWVRIDGDRGWREVRFAGAIDAAMTAQLGADTSYSGRFTHNPLHPNAWDVVELRAEPYTLSELASYVDLQSVPRRAPTSSGIGRNVAAFDRLRHWAYGAVSSFAKHGRGAWDAAVAAKAGTIAVDVRAEFPNTNHAYRDCEVRATARSVARWTWERYVAGVPIAVVEARAIVAAENARRRAENARRRRGTVARDIYLSGAADRRTEANQLHAAGASMRAIAERLGIALRTAYALVKNAVQCPSRTQNLDLAPSADPATIVPEKGPPDFFLTSSVVSSPSVSVSRTDAVVSRIEACLAARSPAVAAAFVAARSARSAVLGPASRSP